MIKFLVIFFSVLLSVYSSDSFACLDVCSSSSLDYIRRDGTLNPTASIDFPAGLTGKINITLNENGVTSPTFVLQNSNFGPLILTVDPVSFTFSQGVSPVGIFNYDGTGFHFDQPLSLKNTLIWATDNTYDIGASGATRPRTIYAGTGINTPKISNLTTNGFVKTSSGNGTLSVDTTTYGTGTVTSITAGTGLTGGAITTSGTINSNAVEHLSYQPGLLTAINSNIGVYYKASKTSTIDNIIGSAVTFSCVSNPTITMYECGTSATCTSSPVTIGTVTVTALATATVGTVNNAAVTAGDYIGWAFTAGTCASIDISVTAQIHSN